MLSGVKMRLTTETLCFACGHYSTDEWQRVERLLGYLPICEKHAAVFAAMVHVANAQSTPTKERANDDR